MTRWLEQRLDALPVGTSETLISENCAIRVKRSQRGAYAMVDDAGSRHNGLNSFGGTPSLALALLRYKLAAKQEDIFEL